MANKHTQHSKLKFWLLLPIRLVLLCVLVVLGFTVLFPEWMDHKDKILYELFDIKFEGGIDKDGYLMLLDRINILEFSSKDKQFEQCIHSHKKASGPIAQGIRKINEIKSLKCVEKNISAADGIDSLQQLRSVYLKGNKITEIDVSKLSKLNRIDLNFNQLSSLDVSENHALKTLMVGGNNLKHLKIPQVHRLEKLVIALNPIAVSDILWGEFPKKLILDEKQLAQAQLDSPWITNAKLEYRDQNFILTFP